MIPLFVVQTTTRPTVQAAPGVVERCRRCKRLIKDPESLGYHIGPKCREHLGIEPRRPVRVGGVQAWRDIPGQADLLDGGDEQEADL